MSRKAPIELDPILSCEHHLLYKFFPRGIIVIDLETTGLSPLIDEIIEIAAIKLVPQNQVQHFNQLIDPQISIPKSSIHFHGIEDHHVANSPPIEHILPKFFKFKDDLPIIAHNAQYDSGFLIQAAERFQINFKNSSIYCSLALFKYYFSSLETYKLKNLTKTFNINILHHHRAMDDAQACLKLLIIALKKIQKEKKDGEISKVQRMFSSKIKILEMKDLLKKKSNLPIKDISILKDLFFLECVRSQSLLEIIYDGGTQRGKPRSIIPCSILRLEGKDVLYARCLSSDVYKHFILKKIITFVKKSF